MDSTGTHVLPMDIQETIVKCFLKSLKDVSTTSLVCKPWGQLLNESRTLRDSFYRRKPWLFVYSHRKTLSAFDPLTWRWITVFDANYSSDDLDRVPLNFGNGGAGIVYYQWKNTLFFRINYMSGDISSFVWPATPPTQTWKVRPLVFLSNDSSKLAVADARGAFENEAEFFPYLEILDLKRGLWETSPPFPATFERPNVGAVVSNGLSQRIVLLDQAKGLCCSFDLEANDWQYVFRVFPSSVTRGSDISIIDGGDNGLLLAGLVEDAKESGIYIKVWRIVEDVTRFCKEWKQKKTPIEPACVELSRMPFDIFKGFFDNKVEETAIKCKGNGDLIYFCNSSAEDFACVFEVCSGDWKLLPKMMTKSSEDEFAKEKEFGCWNVSIDTMECGISDSMEYLKKVFPKSAKMYEDRPQGKDFGDGLRMRLPVHPVCVSDSVEEAFDGVSADDLLFWFYS